MTRDTDRLDRWRRAGATDAELEVIAELGAYHLEPEARARRIDEVGDGQLRDELQQAREAGLFGDVPEDDDTPEDDSGEPPASSDPPTGSKSRRTPKGAGGGSAV